jgi:hypothetical protein
MNYSNGLKIPILMVLIRHILAHQSFQDVVDFIVPELQKRGVYPKQYSEGTLREKLFQNNAHLPDWHRGAAYRKN